MHRARGKKKEKRGKGHHTAPTENRPKQTRQRKGRRPGGGKGGAGTSTSAAAPGAFGPMLVGRKALVHDAGKRQSRQG